MKEKKITIIKLIVNILIVLLELIGFVIIYKKLKLGLFVYYTECSNLLLLISSCMIIFELINKLNGNKIKIKKKYMKILDVFRYTACLSVFVTLLVVLTILGPTYPSGYYGIMLSDSMLYHHTLCPILAIISFTFLEKYEFNTKDVIRSLYFTFTYAIILILLNILNVVDGPYPFLRVQSQSILTSVFYFVLIIGGTIVLSFVFRLANRKLCIE